MKINYIKDGPMLIAIHIPGRSNPWPKETNFLTANEHYIQVATQKHKKSATIPAHRHLQYKREVQKTQEVLFIKKGKMKTDFFGCDNKRIKTLVLKPGDILILLEGGHGYEMLTPTTEFLEIKNGPFISSELDRKRL